MRALFTLGLVGALFLLGVTSHAESQALSASPVNSSAQASPQLAAFLEEPEVAVMRRELERNMQRLQLPNKKPAYYLAYWLLRFQEINLESNLGAIVTRDINQGRRVRAELRVGNSALDNSFSEAGGSGFITTTEGMASAPRDVSPHALQRSLWLLTDNAYREALDAYDRKRTERSSQVELEARPLDFSEEPASVTLAPSGGPLPSVEVLEQAISEASARFRQFPAVHQGVVEVDAWSIERTLVTSEGTLGREPATVIEFTLRAEGQAADGMPLEQSVLLYGVDAISRLSETAQKLGEELTAMASAEVAPDYSGPVLFVGSAAPQLLHDLVAGAVSGTPSDQEGPFARKLGKRVLPASASLLDDPTRVTEGAQVLAGAYLMDDEGVPSQRVELVKDGRLRALLASRAPSLETPHSNGHGRSGLGGWARGAVGNLFLTSSAALSDRELEARLLRAVRAEGGEYGLVVERLEPRSFASQGSAPPAPERVYKLYLDGHRVLVRGGTFREMNVRDLRDILAFGSKPTVYDVMVATNGYPVPSSVVAPGMLFEQVELTKPKRSLALPKPISRPEL